MHTRGVRFRRAAVVVFATLVCGCGSLSVYTPTPKATPAPSSTTYDTVESFIPVAEKFVEKHRGLTFQKSVPVSLLDDAAFRKQLASENSEEDQAAVEKSTKELRALGLIQGNPDLTKISDALLGDLVAGFYDTKAQTLYVRGAKPTPYVQEVLVHELTHAVQDQHFTLNRPKLLDENDEQATAFQAVYEGDAVRIEHEYRQSLPDGQQKQAADEETKQGNAANLSDVPPVLLETLSFPYVLGPTFVDFVVNARGQSGLDAAFVKPPTTTAEIIHPDKYLQGEGARTVEVPPADETAIDTGVVGEFGLDLILEPGTTSGKIDANAAHEAAQSWAGDAYVAWDSGSQTCVRARIVTAQPSDEDALAAVLQTYVSTRTGASVEKTSDFVTLTACG